jgi:hypothetical protein
MEKVHKKQISIPFKKPSKQKKRKRKDGEGSGSRGGSKGGLDRTKKNRVVAETPLKDQLEKGQDSGSYLNPSAGARRSPRINKASSAGGAAGGAAIGANRGVDTRTHHQAGVGGTAAAAGGRGVGLSFSRGIKQGGGVATPRTLKSKSGVGGAERRSSPRIRQLQGQDGRRPPPQYSNGGDDDDEDDDDTVPSTPRDKKRRGPQRALSL